VRKVTKGMAEHRHRSGKAGHLTANRRPRKASGLLAVLELNNSINFKLHLTPSGNLKPSSGFPQTPLGVTFHMVTSDFWTSFEIFEVIDHLNARE